ncbi:MAG TPA: biosynthetic-type acetolactate synthase large subunit [Phycisphaerae bacterium]|nr:biosynthetic-type acetolactate synthase large subunit [Phycisphaerae bacterium]
MTTRTGSPPSTSTPKTCIGAQAFVDALLQEGVEVMFGYSGGAILPFFDRLYDAPIRFVLSRHEQGAGHMADGYARATGKVGVCVATSGPGATNLTTALATAYMDSIPVVAFTGQVPTSAIGNDAFQEADIIGVTRPVTKHNALVSRASDLPRIVKEAFYVARTGRPGPVLVDLPKDVQVAQFEVSDNVEMDLPGYRPRVYGHARQIRLAADHINRAERPVLYVGGGVVLAGASDEVRQLARKGNIPVTTTLLGLGAFDEVGDADLALHMLGMHGSVYANYAVQNCDVLIAVGARFDDRVTGRIETFAPHATIIHIDVDPASISKSVDVDVPVVGDAKKIISELLGEIERRERSEWFAQIDAWRKQYPFSYDSKGTNIKPQYVIEEVCRQTESQAIIATGVGQHQMWAAQYYRWRFPRQMITSGGLGTMGFGLPAAIGAQVGQPGRTVVDIDGDGSFTMTLPELATAVEQNLPVKVVLLNNSFQGMVRQWQELFFNKRYSATRMQNPDFARLADAFGAKGLRITEKADVRDGVRELLETEGCVVADFHVEPEENVYPMVNVGKSLDEMDLGGLA